MGKLEMTALALVLLTIVGLPAAAFGYEALRSQQSNEFTIIAVGGPRWSPQTIRVQQGETVRLRLTSEDVMHGFAIDGIPNTAVKVYPGIFTVVRFVAEQPGTYRFVCMIKCGSGRGHRDMTGTLIVEPRPAAEAVAESR